VELLSLGTHKEVLVKLKQVRLPMKNSNQSS